MSTFYSPFFVSITGALYKSVWVFLFCAFSPHSVWADPGDIAEGFDVLLIIDDSASMGTVTSTQKKTRSDPEGRRYQAVNLLLNQFYNASRIRDKVGEQELDIRFSILGFGSSSAVLSDWFVVNSEQPPRALFLSPENRVWTNFNSAFANAIEQYQKIDFGRRLDQSSRELRIIILTDGEPSVRANPDELYKNPKVWAQMYEQLNTIELKNDSLQVYLLALNNPKNNYWKKVKDQWQAMASIPVKPVVIETLGLSNAQLYSILAEEVVEKITPIGYLKPDSTGRFTVPCFQSTMSVEVYFLDKPAEVKLRAPDGRIVKPVKQSRYLDSPTYMQFDIDEPLSGDWQFIGYDNGFFQSIYTVIPFSVQYDYPGLNGELLPTPNTIKMRLNSQDGGFVEEQIKGCAVSGTMHYKHKVEPTHTNAAQGALAFTHYLDPKTGDLILESEQKFKADVTTPSYQFNFNLMSKGESVFKDSRVFKLSNKIPLLIQVQNSAVMVSPRELVFTLDIRFQDYLTKKSVAVADIFTDPDQALMTRVMCEHFDCERSQNMVVDGPTTSKNAPSIQASLSVIDSQTLGIRLSLIKRGDRLSRLLSLFLDGAKQQVGYELKAAPGAGIADSYVFIDGP